MSGEEEVSPASPAAAAAAPEAAVTVKAFTPSQWRTFLAIADTLFPAQTPAQIEEILATLPQGPGNRDAIVKFLSRSASECAEFTGALEEVFAWRVPREAVGKIKGVLDLLDSGIFTFLLTRTFTAFHTLPLAARAQVLQNWSQSWFAIFRALQRQLQLIFSNTMLKTNPLLLAAIEYPLFPPAYTPESNDPLHPSCATPAPPFHQPAFHIFPDADDLGLLELHSDIAIVGSGAGGGVIAARLARDLCPRGKRITILEKATFLPPPTLPLPEAPLAAAAHDNAGVMSTRDGHGLCVTGATWGGGTAINWGITLSLEPAVQAEWSALHHLGGVVDSPEWADCQRHIRERMGVAAPDPEKHLNAPNRLIWEGARKAGLEPVTLPLNCGGRMDEHAACSYCSGGCRSGAKQGTNVSFLVDAEKAGARCITGVEITRLLWADPPSSPSPSSTSTSSTPERVCAGVEGWFTPPPSNSPGGSPGPTTRRPFRLYAPRVILSCGALRTPLILHASNLTHPSIGANLRVHPCNFVYGLTPPSLPMTPWLGSPTTVLIPPSSSTEHSMANAAPMKAKIMRMDPAPSMALTCLPWQHAGGAGGAGYLADILAYPHSITLLTLVRDTDSHGTVRAGPGALAGAEFGPPDITYAYSARDQASAIDGLITSCRVLLEGGCSAVVPCIPLPAHLARFTPPPGCASPSATPEFEAYAAQLRRHGPGPGWVSGHQMGTARWGGSEGDGSVCDAARGGRVWGAKGVYVVDGSAFPGASGVNPMATVMGLAEWAGRRVVEEVLREEGGGEGGGEGEGGL